LYYNERLLLHSSLISDLQKLGIKVDVYSTVKNSVDYAKTLNFNNFYLINKIFLPTKIISTFKKILNYSWDYHLKYSNSRKFISFVQNKNNDKFYKFIGFIIAKFKLTLIFNRFFIFLIRLYSNFTNKIDTKFKENLSNYDLVIFGWAYSDFNIIYANYCKANKIKTCALISGYDNISTKSRILFNFDFYFIWSEYMEKEFNYFYPYVRNSQLKIIGNPQYEILKSKNFQTEKKLFFKNNNLNSEKLTVLYALGSPNLIREDIMMFELFDFLNTTDISNDIQFIIRPHPAFYDIADWENLVSKYNFPIYIQKVEEVLKEKDFPSVKAVYEWVNAINHCDLLINATSTITFDAIFANKPVLNVNYDIKLLNTSNYSIKEINKNFSHANIVVNSGGVHICNNTVEIVNYLRNALNNFDEFNSLNLNCRKKLLSEICSLEIQSNPLDKFIKSIKEVLIDAK